MSWWNPFSWRSEAKTLQQAWYAGDALSSIIRAQLDGVHVTPTSALRFSAWFGCMRVRSETMSLLPWRVYEYSGNNDEHRERRREHEALLKRPNPETVGSAFWQAMDAWKGTHGNAYAEIERNSRGEPVALWLIEADRVEMRRENGRLYYSVANTGKPPSRLAPADVLHLRGPSLDGVSGLSIVDLARHSIEAGMRADSVKRGWLKNGLFLGGQVVRQPGAGKDLSPDAIKNMMKSLVARFGGPANSGKFAYMDAGHELKPLNMSMRDAQFVDQTKAGVLDVCRWWRMPPHKLCQSDDLPYAQREAAENAFVNDCITPGCRTDEEEVSAKLLPPGVSARRDTRGLLRGDTAARVAYFKERFATGSLSPDEIRAIEDEDPLPNGRGGQYYVPVNMAPIGPDGRPLVSNNLQGPAP